MKEAIARLRGQMTWNRWKEENREGPQQPGTRMSKKNGMCGEHWVVFTLISPSCLLSVEAMSLTRLVVGQLWPFFSSSQWAPCAVTFEEDRSSAVGGENLDSELFEENT